MDGLVVGLSLGRLVGDNGRLLGGKDVGVGSSVVVEFPM